MRFVCLIAIYSAFSGQVWADSKVKEVPIRLKEFSSEKLFEIVEKLDIKKSKTEQKFIVKYENAPEDAEKAEQQRLKNQLRYVNFRRKSTLGIPQDIKMHSFDQREQSVDAFLNRLHSN